jgi:hypothetical protein
MENTHFGRFSPGLSRQNHPAAMVEFWTPGGLSTIFTGLEFDGLLYPTRLQAKVQAMPHSNMADLRLSIAAECDWLVTLYIRKTCHSFRPPVKLSLRKIKVKVNRWLAKGPAHTNQYFSDLT